MLDFTSPLSKDHSLSRLKNITPPQGLPAHEGKLRYMHIQTDPDFMQRHWNKNSEKQTLTRITLHNIVWSHLAYEADEAIDSFGLSRRLVLALLEHENMSIPPIEWLYYKRVGVFKFRKYGYILPSNPDDAVEICEFRLKELRQQCELEHSNDPLNPAGFEWRWIIALIKLNSGVSAQLTSEFTRIQLRITEHLIDNIRKGIFYTIDESYQLKYIINYKRVDTKKRVLAALISLPRPKNKKGQRIVYGKAATRSYSAESVSCDRAKQLSDWVHVANEVARAEANVDHSIERCRQWLKANQARRTEG